MPPAGDSPPTGTLAVEAPDGFLRDNPEASVRALSRMAALEGADEDDWLLKAAASIVQVRTGGEPRYAVIPEAAEHARRIYEATMAAATDAIVDLIARRAADLARDQQTTIMAGA